VFAMLAALTLLPVLMLAAGRVAFWPRRPAFGSAHPAQGAVAGAKGVWPAIARLVSRRPRAVWVTSILLLAAASLGMFQLKVDGVSQNEFVLGESEARDGQAILGEHFPGGSG